MEEVVVNGRGGDEPARTKVATVEMNPERKELKGKVPTRMQ